MVIQADATTTPFPGTSVVVSDRSKIRSPLLDALRGLAILQVVLWHYFDGYGQQVPGLRHVYALTWSGVDLFFVLSGFLIGGILIDHRASGAYYKAFYGRRILRIMPLYAVLLFSLSFPHNNADPRFFSLWPYLTFTQNFLTAKVDDWGPQWTLVTWSLAVEEQFYLLLPVLIRELPKKWLPWIFAGMVGTAPLARWLCANVIYENSVSTYVLMPCRMDALFLGALAAWAVRRPFIFQALQRRRVPLAACAALLGFVLLRFSMRGHSTPYDPPMSGIGLSCVALFYTVILLIVITTPNPRVPFLLKPLRWLGLGAYSLYLFHLPVLELVGTHAPSSWSSFALLSAAGALTALISAVAWLAVERPSIRFGHRALLYDPDVLRAITLT